MRVIGYTRVSTDEQASGGHSMLQQEEQIRQYCKAYGFELVEIIGDCGVSASIDLKKRPAGSQLITALNEGQAEAVVIRDLDRLFRLTMDGLNTFAWFDRRGICVHSINERLDTDTPEGKLALTIRLATCEFERNKTAQRTRNTMQALKQSGQVYGHVPYGLVNVDGRLFKLPERWADRQYIIDMHNDGDGLSLRKICKQLEGEKIPAPNGGRRWAVSTLSGIIKSHGDYDHIPELPADVDAPDSPEPLRAVAP